MTDILEERLGRLAERLDVSVDDRLVEGVLAALDRSPRDSRRSSRRPGRLALAATAAASFAALLVPGARHAIAEWFGIGSTRIEHQPLDTRVDATFPTLPTLPTTTPMTTEPIGVVVGDALDLGQPVSVSVAAAATGLPAPAAPALGEPLGVYVAGQPSGDQIVVVFGPSPALPTTSVAGVGALLATSSGAVDEGSFLKLVGAETTVSSVQVTTAGGSTVEGIWLAGEPHAYGVVTPDGTFAVDTLRLATNTLLWVADGVQYRLESDLSLEEALSIAAGVVTAE